MKKITVIAFLLALSYCIMYGQTTTKEEKSSYLPTITPDKIWHIESGYDCPWGDCPCYGGLITIKPGNIKTFNEKEYYELINEGSQNRITYVREEEGRVFFYVEECDKEYLLYDFTLNVGDEIFMIDPRDPFSHNQENPCELTEEDLYNYRFKVIQIDEIEYNQVKRKRLKLSWYYFEELHDIWVEGIGSITSGITFPASSLITGSRCLKACYESDELIFEQEPPCCWTHLAINDTQQDIINIYPNPTTGELTITNYKLQITSVEVYDVYGKNLKSNPELNSGVNLKSKIIIDISHLNPGIYFVKVVTEQGEVIKKVVKQ